MKNSERYLWTGLWAGLVAAMVYGSWVGNLAPWDEALSAERAREMLRHGFSLTVSMFGQPDFNKPPLYYWLSALCMKFLGVGGELPVRLPSVLMALGCIGCTFKLARWYGADKAGTMAALLLLGFSPHWLNVTRQGYLESALCLSILGALCLFVMLPQRRTGAVLAGVCMAAGFWFKNPLALVALVPMAAHAWVYREPKALPRLATAALVAVLLGGGWYLQQYAAWGDRFIAYFVDKNVVGRIEGELGDDIAFFYLQSMLQRSPAMLVAFSACLLGSLRFRPPKQALIFLSTAVVWLVLLHIPAKKSHHYTVQAYPYMAIYCGLVFSALRRQLPTDKIRAYVGIGLAVAILGLCAGRYKWEMRLDSQFKEAIDAALAHCPAEAVGLVGEGAGQNRHVASYYLDRLVPVWDGLPQPGDKRCVIQWVDKSTPRDALPDGTVWRSRNRKYVVRTGRIARQ